MSDLSLLNQAQLAIQTAQTPTQQGVGELNRNNSFGSFQSHIKNQDLREPSVVSAIQRRKIRETAEDFEAQFLGQMLQPMFEGIEVEEPFGGGSAEKIWQSMLVNEYGKSMTKAGGIGLADQIERELLRAQEGRFQ